MQAHTSLCGVLRSGWLTRFYTPNIFLNMFIKILTTLGYDKVRMNDAEISILSIFFYFGNIPVWRRSMLVAEGFWRASRFVSSSTSSWEGMEKSIC